MIKLELYDDNTIVITNIEKDKLLMYQYFKDVNEFAKIDKELKIKVQNPIDFAKAIVDNSLVTLVDSMNLLGSNNIYNFLENITGPSRTEIIKYYSNVDPEIWYKMIQNTRNWILYNEIIKSFNQYNLLHFIKNTDTHYFYIYKQALSELKYESTLNNYYKIIIGHMNEILDILNTTIDDKLLKFLYEYCNETHNLDKCYSLLEGNDLQLTQFIKYVADTSHNKNMKIIDYLHPFLIDNYGTRSRSPLNITKDLGDTYIYFKENEQEYIKIITNGIEFMDNKYTITKFKEHIIILTFTNLYKVVRDKYEDYYICETLYDEDMIFNHCILENYILIFTVYNAIAFSNDLTHCKVKNFANYTNISFIENYYTENGLVYELKLDNHNNLYGSQINYVNNDPKYVRILDIAINKLKLNAEDLQIVVTKLCVN